MEGSFPFNKLKHYIYITLDVMMFVDYQDALKFMLSLNKEARYFIEQNFIRVRNGFINDGLIEISFDNDAMLQFNNYE